MSPGPPVLTWAPTPHVFSPGTQHPGHMPCPEMWGFVALRMTLGHLVSTPASCPSGRPSWGLLGGPGGIKCPCPQRPLPLGGLGLLLASSPSYLTAPKPQAVLPGGWARGHTNAKTPIPSIWGTWKGPSCKCFRLKHRCVAARGFCELCLCRRCRASWTTGRAGCSDAFSSLWGLPCGPAPGECQ